jgi:hypothetical protein
MDVALKEWASVIAALGSGRQIFLLRKGGIVEHRKGFEVRHREFVLFPTFEHQHAASLKPDVASIAPDANPERIAIEYMAHVSDVFPAPPNREVWRNADSHHIWNDSLIDMRYTYRPDLPLYLLLVRAFRLYPQSILNRPSYVGCKSWVNLSDQVATADAYSMLEDDAYQEKRTSLLRDLQLQ